MKKRPKVSAAQTSMFQDDTQFTNPSPSREVLRTRIFRLREERRVGQLDYNRWKPLLNQINQAAATKYYNRCKIDGEWYSVAAAKALAKFMRDWTRRLSALEWEIQQAEADLEKLG